MTRRFAHVGSPDLWLVAAAVLFGAPSLTYPLGRDQGLFYYVGREWAERGALPYRDLFEHRPPFLYALHALLVATTGENIWAIRVAELAATVGIGWLAARLLAPDEKPRPGLFGAATFAASVFYYGYLSFGQLANCEIWMTLFAAAGLVVLRRPRHAEAGIAAGALFGLALLAKFPAMALAPLVLYVLYARAPSWRWRLLGLAFAAAGVALPLALAAAYFAARGGLGAAFDILVRANRYYVDHDRNVSSIGDLARLTWIGFDWWTPLGWIFVAACAVGAFRRDARYLRVLAVALCTYGTIAIQLKFFLYHFGALMLPAAMVGAALFDDARELLRRRLPRAAPFTAAAYAAAGAVVACTMVPRDVWRDHVAPAARAAVGAISKDELARSFDSAPGLVEVSATRSAGEWIRAHTSKDDVVLVRGHDAQVYEAAGRSCRCYFFWSVWLTRAERAYRRDEWLARDAADFERTRPLYVVAIEGSPPDSLDAPAYYEARGYERRAAFGGFAILGRAEGIQRGEPAR